MMRLIVFDIEIAKEVEEVGGWEAVREGRAGIGSVALYDSTTKRFHIYGPDIAFDGTNFIPVGAGTLPQCADHLTSADVLIGFNSISFDTPVFESVVGCGIDVPQYDILDMVWSELGNQRTKGYRLGEIAHRTINREKIDKGSSAPKLFKQGRMFELIDYNINDVAITRELCNFITEHGFIIDINGEQMPLPPLGELI